MRMESEHTQGRDLGGVCGSRLESDHQLPARPKKYAELCGHQTVLHGLRLFRSVNH